MTIWQLEFEIKNYCKKNNIVPTRFMKNGKDKIIEVEAPEHKIKAFFTSKGTRIMINGKFAKL